MPKPAGRTKPESARTPLKRRCFIFSMRCEQGSTVGNGLFLKVFRHEARPLCRMPSGFDRPYDSSIERRIARTFTYAGRGKSDQRQVALVR